MNMEHYSALIGLFSQDWFCRPGSFLSYDQKEYVRKRLRDFSNSCDEFKDGVALLEQIENIAADKGVKEDIRSATNYLKQRWNEKDPRSIFDMHRSLKQYQDQLGPIFYFGLLIIAGVVVFVMFQITSKVSSIFLDDKTARILSRNGRSSQQTVSGSNQQPATVEAPLALPDSLERSEQVFRKVSPSIVVVRTGSGQGSGVVVSNGMVATNQHVVSGSSQYFVEYAGMKYSASIAYRDPEYDLCALYVPGLPAPVSPMVTFKSLRVGQRVYAIGAPRGLDLSITDGVVSGIRGYGSFPFIQTNAPISPGSSGGGLFDTSGRLVGITTGSLQGGQAINIAIVADLVSLLPTRSRNNQESMSPVTNPQTAKDIIDKPWADALKQAKVDVSQAETDWKGYTATIKVLQEQRNILVSRMNGLSANRKTAEYNVLVPEENGQLAKIRQLQFECDQKYRGYVTAVDRYNELSRQYSNK